MAFIRALIVREGGANLGNFYRDLVRFTTRVLLPISFVLSLVVYGLSSLGNAGPHRYSEVLYDFTAAAANNGSAFAGLNGNTPWYDLAIGYARLEERSRVQVIRAAA